MATCISHVGLGPIGTEKLKIEERERKCRKEIKYNDKTGERKNVGILLEREFGTQEYELWTHPTATPLISPLN